MFRPVEKAIIAATHAGLPSEAAQLLRRQVEAMRFGSRYLSRSSVEFYQRRRGNVTAWKEELLFLNRHEDLKIAKVRFKAKGKRYTSHVHVVRGHFFMLTTTPGLKPVARATPEISSVDVLADPMDPNAVAEKVLPSTYRKFITQHGAGTHHGWDVLNPDDVYEIKLEEGAYWVLAVYEGDKFLLARPSGRTLFVSEHDDRPRRLKVSFDEALTL